MRHQHQESGGLTQAEYGSGSLIGVCVVAPSHVT